MKSYSNKVELSTSQRFAIPSGQKFHHAPHPGEVFYLLADEPDKTTPDKWYSKGMYVFDGIYWEKISISPAQRRAAPIGAEGLDIERPHKGWPLPTQGFVLSTVTIKPSDRKASFSGTATFWLEHEEDSNVLVSVFRGNKMVSLTVHQVTAKKPVTLAISFVDLPFTNEDLTYILRVNSDKVGVLNINKGSKLGFDGISQSAFIVAENI